MLLAFLLPVLSAVPEASAQRVAPATPPGSATQARELFERGVLLMENNDWDAALVQLQRSFDLRPTQVALFNIGLCLKAVHRNQDAITAFERLLQQFATEGSEERRSLARAEILQLRHAEQRAAVASGEPAAEHAAPQATAPPSASNDAPPAPTFVRPDPPASAPRADPAPTSRASRHQGQEVLDDPHESGLSPAWFWSSTALAGIAAITTGVLGTFVVMGDADYEASRPRTSEDQEAGKRLMLVTDVAFGVSFVAAVGALVLYTQTDFDEQPVETACDERSFRLSLDAASRAGALSIAGVF